MLMDRLTKEQRRKNMKAVKNKDTQIELLLRKELWRRNYRYRKNFKQLPGKPDIVLTKYKIAVFCDSEFWHGYDWENRKNDIKSNRDFWIRKIEGNIKRDKEVTEQLEKEGWIVLRFWGNDIKNNLPGCVKIIEETIKGVEK
jgi:DNA mismatch endonuclease Vsr